MPSMKSKAGVVPRLRFPGFLCKEGWEVFLGGALFDQVSNKNHNSDLPILAITQEYGAIPRDLIDYHVSVAETSLEGYKVVEVSDFIISLRSFQGGIEFSKYRGICSPAYVILRLKGDHSAAYFRHYLKTDRFISQMTKNLEGMRDGKMISYKQFSELHLATPVHAEQERIAACLSSLDDLIAAESQKLEALKTHKKGLMRELFPREGECVPRVRFPNFQDTPAWENSFLGCIFETTSGGTPSRSEVAYWGGDIPWVTTSLVDFCVINGAEEFITKDGLEKSSAKLLPKGAVLIAMYGQGKTRGQVALLNVEATTNQACTAILPKKGIDPYFVFLNLAGRYDELRRLSNSGGQENLSQALIRDFPFSYPLDEAEQQRITDCLSSLDDRIVSQTQKLEVLKTHKKGLMQQLFPVLDEVQK